jgi:ATP-dependent Lon protease
MSQIKNDKKALVGKLTQTVPLLPLRNVIIFPGMVVPLFVGRERSINALEECINKKMDLFLVAQKEETTVNPGSEDIFSVGTLGTILQILRLPDDTVKVLIEGKKRARILRYVESANMVEVEVQELVSLAKNKVEIEALTRTVKTTFEVYVKLNKRVTQEMLVGVKALEDPVKLIDLIAAYLSLKLEDKQSLLELVDVQERMEKLLHLMQGEIEILQVEKRIRSRVKKQMERSQKEYYLNEQMQAIQKELGEKDEFKAELALLEKQIKQKKFSKEAREKAIKELKKLRMMSPMSAEATVVRNYVDWLLALPWGYLTQDATDLNLAKKVMEDDHYGLEDVKERIIEYLAVRLLVGQSKGQILCLVGPPGVGKTSLAKSIARALGKKFVRCSLGGVRDEAEIRGHRRTYVGALPGKIIQSLKKAGSSNPVFLLDEVDKMSTDFRGDPSSALLEVLDPEQNFTFGDHYIEVDYDLSQVMFILTANSLHVIPRPLLDRMEVIHISGYTEKEKYEIVRRYLLSKQQALHGIAADRFEVTDGAIFSLIRDYTKESGVRNLERSVATLCRKAAKIIIEEATKQKKSFKEKGALISVDEALVVEWLGPPKYSNIKKQDVNECGLVNGLAYTDAGGDMLQIEVSVVPGKGQIKVTGQLGEVMQESAATAMSYARSRAQALGLEKDFYQTIDLHLHVPEGAVPKDGPSAGITMATAIVSALTKIPVKQNFAMTGEVTLRGRVLQIGGLKEKLLAAKLAGINTVLIPKTNLPDLKKFSGEILDNIQIVPVEHMDEVLRAALVLENPETFLLGHGSSDLVLPIGPAVELAREEPANRLVPVKH